MTSRQPFELTDAGIERMLEARARSAAPAGLVPAVAAAIDRTPQRSRGLIPTVRPVEGGLSRGWLIAAAFALMALTIATAVIGSRLLQPPTPLVVVPAVPAPSASASPTVPATTPTAAATPTARATAMGPTPASPPGPQPNGPLIVYAIVKDHVEIFTLDVATGSRIRVGTLQNRTGPAGQSIHWTADHRRAIAFGNSDSVVAEIDVQRKKVVPLRLPADGFRDSVSASGDLVARMTAIDDGPRFVSIVDLDGNEVHRSEPLKAGLTPLDNTWWSPDGSWIVVSTCDPCEKAADNSHLYRVPVAGGPNVLFADNTAPYMGSLAFSPDGSTIAFEDSTCGEGPCSGGIGVVRLADGLVTQLTNGGGGSPAWSPDGRRIAFSMGASPQAGIYVMDADGTNIRRLTTAGSGVTDGDRDPIWSPNGQLIVFSRGPYDASMGDLYVVPASGGKPQLLVKNAVADW